MNEEIWCELFFYLTAEKINEVYERENSEAVLNSVVIDGLPVTLSLKTEDGWELSLCLNDREIDVIDCGYAWNYLVCEDEEWEQWCGIAEEGNKTREEMLDRIVEPYVSGCVEQFYRLPFSPPSKRSDFQQGRMRDVCQVLSDLGINMVPFAEKQGLALTKPEE